MVSTYVVKLSKLHGEREKNIRPERLLTPTPTDLLVTKWLINQQNCPTGWSPGCRIIDKICVCWFKSLWFRVVSYEATNNQNICIHNQYMKIVYVGFFLTRVTSVFITFWNLLFLSQHYAFRFTNIKTIDLVHSVAVYFIVWVTTICFKNYVVSNFFSITNKE